jgi:predicted pyridoxine 5'-phosphate oxidase superfamily flavin-nucleotide-binding protein
VEDSLDTQHRTFHQSMQFMPIATLDREGRPWASLLTGLDGERGFISSKDRYSLQIRAAVVPGDPASENLQNAGSTSLPLVAGVGVELLNRRRNKWGGYLKGFERVGDEMLLDLQINSALGNCPVSRFCQIVRADSPAEIHQRTRAHAKIST